MRESWELWVYQYFWDGLVCRIIILCLWVSLYFSKACHYSLFGQKRQILVSINRFQLRRLFQTIVLFCWTFPFAGLHFKDFSLVYKSLTLEVVMSKRSNKKKEKISESNSTNNWWNTVHKHKKIWRFTEFPLLSSIESNRLYRKISISTFQK